jgi:hypothetical protein
MPEITLNNFGLEGKSPAELEQRRREVVKAIASFPKQYDDPDCPEVLLQELALITGTLRRRTAGPPKEAKASKRSGAPKATVEDMKALFS